MPSQFLSGNLSGSDLAPTRQKSRQNLLSPPSHGKGAARGRRFPAPFLDAQWQDTGVGGVGGGQWLSPTVYLQACPRRGQGPPPVESPGERSARGQVR